MDIILCIISAILIFAGCIGIIKMFKGYLNNISNCLDKEQFNKITLINNEYLKGCSFLQITLLIIIIVQAFLQLGLLDLIVTICIMLLVVVLKSNVETLDKINQKEEFNTMSDFILKATVDLKTLKYVCILVTAFPLLKIFFNI